MPPPKDDKATAAGTREGEEPSALRLLKLETSVVLWLILFVFGGGLLALYYADIGYFPEVTWQDALTYMALMTIIGGSLLVAYAFLLFVPGAIWAVFLIADEQLKHVLTMAHREDEPCVFQVAKRLLFPFALFMVFCHCLLYLLENGEPQGLVAGGAAASLTVVSGLLAMILLEALRRRPPAPKLTGSTRERLRSMMRSLEAPLPRYGLLVVVFHVPLLAALIAKAIDDDRRLGPVLLWAAALLPLLSLLGLLRRKANAEGASKPPEPAQETAPAEDATRDACGSVGPAEEPHDKGGLLCRAILAFGSAALLSLAALWFFYRVYRSKAPGSPAVEVVPLGLLVLCTLVVILANLAVSVIFLKHRGAALLASFLAALLLLGAGYFLLHPEQRLPTRIMARFGFGVRDVTLVLTEKGARTLCEQGIIPVIGKKQEPATTAPGQGSHRFARAAGATIISRLGSEYLLRFGDEGNGKKVTLLKAEVVSWSVRENQEPETAAGQGEEDLCQSGAKSSEGAGTPPQDQP